MQHPAPLRRTVSALWISLSLSFIACGADDKLDVPQQTAIVEKARVEWQAEHQRLGHLRDSLEIKIREDVEIGMSPEQARAIETAFIRSQEALVKAAGIRVEAEKDLLEMMQKR